jgi:hypothetical protein
MEWAETETIGIDATDFPKMTPDLGLVNIGATHHQVGGSMNPQ